MNSRFVRQDDHLHKAGPVCPTSPPLGRHQVYVDSEIYLAHTIFEEPCFA